MRNHYQIAFIGAVGAVLAACSTTPPGPNASQAQARTERICVEQERSTGSRLSRQVCRTVEKEPEEQAVETTEG